MKRGSACLLMVLWATQAHAATLWATWELDLAGHAPPDYFVLSVKSPSGAPVPPPTRIPWASCTQVPGAQHCAPIGCPPQSQFIFYVAAHYAEGLSAEAQSAICTITTMQQCDCTTAGTPPPSPPPVPVPAPPPAQPPPDLPQHGPEGLDLRPIGALPASPVMPARPASGAA